MVIDKLNSLKRKLEEQVLKEDSYDVIYKTSAEIDKLINDYYSEYENIKKDLNR